MKNLVVLLGALLSISAHAEGLSIQDAGTEYVTKVIQASKVKAINLVLKKEVERVSCNKASLSPSSIRTVGTGSGIYDSYIVSVFEWATAMHCPLESPIKETLRTDPISYKSFSSGDVEGVVYINVIVPKGYEMEVTEVQ